MKKRIRVLSAVLAAVLAAGSLAGCSGSGSAETTAAASAETSGSGETTAAAAEADRPIKDNLVIALIEEPQAISPGISSISANSHVGRQIHDSLVRRNEATGEISPCLADEWEQVDELT